MLTKLVKTGLRQFGFEIRRINQVNIPFGTDWYYDLRYFLQGKPLNTVFDVGANIGSVACRLAENFLDSTIYAFEPVPTTFEKLVENTRKTSSIRPINLAFGDRIGQAQITAVPLSERNTLVEAGTEKSSNSSRETVTIDIDTIDNFTRARGIHRIDLLKIDTEGAEMKVLKGSERLLAEGRASYILAECEFSSRFNNEPHGNFIEIFHYLQPFQYQVVSFYTAGIDNLGWRWGDVLFRHTTHQIPGEAVCAHRLTDLLTPP